MLNQAIWSTAENAALLREALAWVRSFGVDLHNTRFGRYVAELERYASDIAAGRSPENTPLFFAASADSAVLLEGYLQLRGRFDAYVANRIRKASSGTDSVVDETEHNNAGRNFCFELSTASWLVSCGLDLSCDDSADVAGDIAGRYLVVECKRPRSAAQIEKRGREAVRRLRERFAQTTKPNIIGAVAFDFTPIVNPELQLLRAPNMDNMVLYQIGAGGAQLIANRLGRLWRAWNHPDIVAVFHRVTLVGSGVEKDATLLHQTFQAMHPLADTPSSPHMPFLTEFSRLAKEHGTRMMLATQGRGE